MQNIFDDNWNSKWETHWKPLLLDSTGKFNEQQIKNELHDLVFMYEQISEVYPYITNGALSKPMYFAETIIEHHEIECQKSYEEGFNDGVDEKELRKKIDLIEAASKLVQIT